MPTNPSSGTGERRPYEPMTLIRQSFGEVSKHSLSSLNTRPPHVTATVVDHIDGCEIGALMREFGSPLFVVSEERLRGEFRAFRDAFRSLYPETEVAYSYKTNYLPAVCSILHEEGAWAEVVSGFEYEMAKRLGIPGNRIVFNGPSKTNDDLRRAVCDGALINLDNFDEISAIEEVAQKEGIVPTVGVRVTAEVTMEPWGKFGFSLEAGFAEEACQTIIASPYLELGAIHVHLGTDISSPEPYKDLINVLLPLMEKMERHDDVHWKMLDIGGGFPNRHRYARSHPDVLHEDVFPSFADAIVKPLAEGLFRLKSRPRLILEPGRAVVEHPVFLLTTVTAVKRLPNESKAAILDAGVHLLPTAHYTYLDIVPVESGSFSVEEVTLFGPLCMQVDCLAHGIQLPPIRRGSRLVVRNCGAYTISMAMQFIQGRPAVILVSGEKAEILREAESVEDFIGRDQIPKLLPQIPGREE